MRGPQSPIHGISHTHDMVYVNEKPLTRPILGISAAIINRYFDLSLVRLLVEFLDFEQHFPISILVATNTIENTIFLHGV